jgi:hypothetical protein
MTWGTIEVEPEVAEWLESLSSEEFGRVAFYVDLLESKGANLGEPYTRQLRGKLRELRFYLGRQQTRISYYIGPARTIVLLTVFTKQRRREKAEIERAEAAMKKCIRERHVSGSQRR